MHEWLGFDPFLIVFNMTGHFQRGSRGRSRSLKMAPFDRPYAAIVSKQASCLLPFIRPMHVSRTHHNI